MYYIKEDEVWCKEDEEQWKVCAFRRARKMRHGWVNLDPDPFHIVFFYNVENAVFGIGIESEEEVWCSLHKNEKEAEEESKRRNYQVGLECEFEL